MKEGTAPALLSRAEIEKRIDTLPTLPSVVAEVIALDPTSDEFHLKVREFAHRDPPFAVRILAAANSASLAPVAPILSMPEALMRLGARHVAQLVTSLSVMRVFIPRTEGDRNLWRHSIQAAVAARTIASHGRGVDPQLAYIAGLLHDIGRFVMFEHDPAEVEAVDGTHWTTPSELLSAERKLCGFDHAEVGARACQVWGLPHVIGEVVRLHHAVELDAVVQQPVAALVRVVQQADALSCLLIKNPTVASMDPLARLAEIERFTPSPKLGSPPATPCALSSFTKQIQDESTELAAGLGLRRL